MSERGIIHVPKDPGSKEQTKNKTKQKTEENYRTPNPAISMNLVLLFIALVVILGVTDMRTSSSQPSKSPRSAMPACRSQKIFRSLS